MLTSLLISSLVAAASVTPVAADAPSKDAETTRGLQFSVGSSALAYLSAYAATSSFALETSAAGPIVGAWAWGAGGRLAFAPALPEGFVRVVAAPSYRIWAPSAGLELGVTARCRFDDEEGVLAEFRAASQRDISPFYVAINAAPFDFRLLRRFRLSVLELQVGTQLDPLGEFVRLQLGLVSLAMELP